MLEFGLLALVGWLLLVGWVVLGQLLLRESVVLLLALVELVVPTLLSPTVVRLRSLDLSSLGFEETLHVLDRCALVVG